MASTTRFGGNMIARMELVHLRRQEGQNGTLRRLHGWLLKTIVLGWVCIVAFIFVKSPQDLTGRIVWQDIGLLVIVWVALTLALHFATVHRTLMIASESMMREKRSRTWESILVTGVDARQVVLGKWWAAVRVSWHDYLLLTVMRAGAVVVVGTAFSVDAFMIAPVAAGAGNMMLAMLLIVPFTLLNCLFTAAAGVFGGLITTRQDGVALPAAVVVRTSVVLIPVVSLIAVGLYLTQSPAGPGLGEDAVQPLLLFLVSLLENGLLVTLSMVNSLDLVVLYGFVALSVLVFYGALTLGLLAASQYAAQHQGMLPPEKLGFVR